MSRRFLWPPGASAAVAASGLAPRFHLSRMCSARRRRRQAKELMIIIITRPRSSILAPLAAARWRRTALEPSVHTTGAARLVRMRAAVAAAVGSEPPTAATATAAAVAAVVCCLCVRAAFGRPRLRLVRAALVEYQSRKRAHLVCVPKSSVFVCELVSVFALASNSSGARNQRQETRVESIKSLCESEDVEASL